MAKKKQAAYLEDVPESTKKIEGLLVEEYVLTEADDLAREFYDKGRYGELVTRKKFQYTLLEAMFLLERGKISIKKTKKELSFDDLLKHAKKKDKNFWVRYCVFRDLRRRGYIVKTALKFGADFRVYDRGIKPGEDHAKWVVFPVSESQVFSWYEFSAKNRVAHSTRKRLMIGIVDAESDVTFMEVKWIRP